MLTTEAALLSLRNAIETAERRLVTSRVVQSAQKAAAELMVRDTPSYRAIDAFLFTRNTANMTIPASHIDEKRLDAAWRAYRILEQAIRENEAGSVLSNRHGRRQGSS